VKRAGRRTAAVTLLPADSIVAHRSRRLPVQPAAVVLLCALVLNACAADDKTAVLEQGWAKDKQQIHSELAALRDQQVRADQADEKQAAELVDLAGRVAALEQLSQTQQAQIKALSSKIESLHRSRPARASVAARTKQPELAAKAAISPKPEPRQRTTAVKALPPVASPVAATPKVDKAALAEAEKNAYTAAYLALKSGRYEEAATAFNKQLDLYPDGEYADQAWYWLGEGCFAQNDSERALNAFKYVADHFPDSVKHAAALFKLAQIAEMRKQPQQAARYYQRLIRDHADSSLAGQAREALTRLQGGSTIPPATDTSPEN